MMFTIVFLLSTLVQPGFFQCADNQISKELPGDICDPSRCLSLSEDTFAIIGNANMKIYAYTMGDKALVGYCPLKLDYTFSPPSYGVTTRNVTLTAHTNSGIDCNVPATFSREYTAEPDSAGNFSLFTIKEGGETWQICHVYHEYDGAYVCRSCRIDPPPSYGNSYGYVYVYYHSDDKCKWSGADDFLKMLNVKINFEQISVDCSKSYGDEGDDDGDD